MFVSWPHRRYLPCEPLETAYEQVQSRSDSKSERRHGQDDHRRKPRRGARHEREARSANRCRPAGRPHRIARLAQPDELETTLATHLEAVARDEPLEPDAGILKHPEGVDLMPANIELSGTEVALVTAMNRERTLKAWLDEGQARLRLRPHRLHAVPRHARRQRVGRRRSVIVPVQAAVSSQRKGMTQLVKTIWAREAGRSPHLEIEGCAG